MYIYIYLYLYVYFLWAHISIISHFSIWFHRSHLPTCGFRYVLFTNLPSTLQESRIFGISAVQLAPDLRSLLLLCDRGAIYGATVVPWCYTCEGERWKLRGRKNILKDLLEWRKQSTSECLLGYPQRRILASSLFISLGGSSSLDLAGEMSELSQRFCAEHIQKLKSHDRRSFEQKTLSSPGNWGWFYPYKWSCKNPTSNW